MRERFKESLQAGRKAERARRRDKLPAGPRFRGNIFTIPADASKGDGGPKGDSESTVGVKIRAPR